MNNFRKNNFMIAATPIGNYGDITLRALEFFKKVDFVVCESEKEYKKLFGILGLEEKKFILCNEHHETESIDLTLSLLKSGEKGVLISDCGIPLFEDPGQKLLQALREKGYVISALPGASSLTTALALSPFEINDFYYAGLLPRNKTERLQKVKELLKKKEGIIFLEAPYRLKDILDVLKRELKRRRVAFFFNLTMENEIVIWGTIGDVFETVSKEDIKKAEFVVFIEGQ